MKPDIFQYYCKKKTIAACLLQSNRAAGMRSNVIIAVLLTVGCFFQQTSQAQTNGPSLAQFTIAWERSPDSDVAGYNLYYGTNVGVYMGKVNVGKSLTNTVNVPIFDGADYYFTATAYSADGRESPFSNVISTNMQTSGNSGNSGGSGNSGNNNSNPARHYEGLFYNTNSVTLANSGAFRAEITTNGTYTASMIQGTNLYTYLGSVGHPVFNLVSTNGNALLLQWDATDTNKLTGIVASRTWSSDLTAYRTATNPLVGKYTLAIAGCQPSQSAGYSTLSITVCDDSKISVGGYAADGGIVTEGTALLEHGYWPLYLTVNNGVLFGWQTLLPGATNLTGWAYWFKPSSSVSRLSSIAYCDTNPLGSTYTNKAAILNFTKGVMVLSGGNLTNNLTNSFSLTNNIAIDSTKGNGFNLTFLTNLGIFSGSITNPATKKPISFSGAVLQQQNKGVGAFQGSNQMGTLWLTPVQ